MIKESENAKEILGGFHLSLEMSPKEKCLLNYIKKHLGYYLPSILFYEIALNSIKYILI